MNLRSVLFIVMCLSFRGFSQACDTLTIKKLVGQADLELSKDVDRSYQLAFKAYSLSRECPNTTY
ncbi:MAG: hypothetical protein K0S26_904, partial [Bacteroidota bacterium]|nr:hypothetical protein [Bacteroidota bacterium]